MIDDARAALAAAGERWRAAVSDEHAAAACDAGVPEREATRLAGVDRMTVRRARGKRD